MTKPEFDPLPALGYHGSIMLTNNTLDIWTIPLNVPESELLQMFSVLNEEEKKSAMRFRFDKHRRRYIASHAAMRTILAKALSISAANLQFQTQKEGKPYLLDNPLYFNLSHSEELAMLVLSDQGEVGIDIEYLNFDIDTINIPKRFFHPLECEQLEQMPAEKRPLYFYYCWTGKEAYLKAKGVGIANHLQQFSLDFQNPANIKVRFTTQELEDFKNWTVYTFRPKNNYLSTVVSSTASNNLHFHEYKN